MAYARRIDPVSALCHIRRAMADVFISYKREDRELAERLAHALEQLGFDVWWDFDLLAGDKYRRVIREVIDKCSAAIVLWSGKSVESDFVMDEASHAKNRGKLCPARIDEVDLPFGFGQTHTDDLIGWDGELTHAGFQGLVRSLETRVGRKAKLGAVRRSAESQAANTELEAFQAAQLAGNVAALKAFLKEHPRGTFASFVRGQIETMEPQAVEPSASRPPPRDERPAETSPPSGTNTPPTPPWPKIAGVVIVVLGIGGLFVYHQNAQEETRRAQEELRAQQERFEQERKTREAAEARAKELEAKAQQDREAREQAERERIAMEKAEEQRHAREQAERERIAREKAGREKAEREAERQRQEAAQAEQQRQAREQAQREREARAARDAEDRAKAAAQSAPFDLAQLHPDVRNAVERARGAERRALATAARARDAADRARASGTIAPESGLGLRRFNGGGKLAGDEYAGQFEKRQVQRRRGVHLCPERKQYGQPSALRRRVGKQPERVRRVALARRSTIRRHFSGRQEERSGRVQIRRWATLRG